MGTLMLLLEEAAVDGGLVKLASVALEGTKAALEALSGDSFPIVAMEFTDGVLEMGALEDSVFSSSFS